MRTTSVPAVIATLPPYVSHRPAIINHPLVTGLRFNISSPEAETPLALLRRLQSECGQKPLWIDLKGRQPRITKFAYLPYAFVELSHRIVVYVPCPIHFKYGTGTIVRVVNGNKLILEDRPDEVVGEGQPVNILHPSLVIEGYLTKQDHEHIQAAVKLGMHDYMLSFVESGADIRDVLALDPKARIVAKIESRRGMEFLRREFSRWRRRVRLMAARDDLYVNMGDHKQDYLPALQSIIAADHSALVASRLLTSLENSELLASQDVSDLALMLDYGYRTIVLSDGIGFRRDVFLRAIAALESLLKPVP